MLKYTLVPSFLFNKEESYKLLSELVPLDGKDMAKHIELPDFKAVLIYAVKSFTDTPPVVAEMLGKVLTLPEYNKLLACYDGRYIHIVLAQGRKLLLCNSFDANDPITAEYFIFAAIKKFQLNPEITTLFFYGDTPDGMKNELFRYFHSVETL